MTHRDWTVTLQAPDPVDYHPAPPRQIRPPATMPVRSFDLEPGLDEHLRDCLREMRQAAGLTQEEMGRLIGRSSREVRRIEAIQAGSPRLTVQHLVDYSEATGIGISVVIG